MSEKEEEKKASQTQENQPPVDETPTATPSEEVREEKEEAVVEDAAKEEDTAAQPIPNDEELEAEDTHEDAVDADEESGDHHFEEDEIPLPEYSDYSVEKLISEAETLLKQHAVHKLKAHFDSIRKHVLKQLNEERDAKLAEFIEGGGNQLDFEYVQPNREKFRNLYGNYRAQRKKYYDDLSNKLNDNLRVKKELIEKLKELVTRDESIGDIFKEFNDIQQHWRDTGAVPRAEAGELWRVYHHHVENFYEFIKINKELRDLDFKKNHETKERLIKEAEELLNMEQMNEAFKRLQSLHKKWKHVGPVEREHREPLWERFSAITKQMHEKRDAHYEALREKGAELIEEKKALVEKIKGFPIEKVKTHQQWQEAIKGMEAIRQAFVRIGRINHPENDVVWEEFRSIMREFNHQKNSFYKGQKKEFQENLEKKRALLERAEKLKDSEDWKNTTNELKRIQADWKRIGHVPRSESDKIWKKFRAACNHFFNRLTENNKALDAAFEGNLTQKQALLEKLKAYDTKGDKKQVIADLKEMINSWRSIGKVPRSAMQIDSEFNNTLDGKFKAIDMDRKESQRVRFENRMEVLTSDDNDDYALRKERGKLYQQKEDAEKELNQLENNMGFFSSSNSNNPLLKEAQKKIDAQRNFISSIEEKIKMLNIKIREVNAAAEADNAPQENDSEEEKTEE